MRSSQHGMKNGVIYRVESVRKGWLKLEGVDKELSAELVGKICRPAWALTYFAAQGKTMRGKIRCCDTNHANFTWTMLLVGVSRATAYDFVQVE